MRCWRPPTFAAIVAVTAFSLLAGGCGGGNSAYHQAFHDVKAANANTAEFPLVTITGYRPGPGWDPVTGWGSPNAEVLVPLLAHDANR